MSSEFSFKDFENVLIKSTQSIETGTRHISEGEVIARFDKIQIAGLHEAKEYITAHGGYGDRDWVYWETTRQLDLTFSQGVFSKEQFSLLLNSKLGIIENETALKLTEYEEVETDENGIATLKHEPVEQVFVYSKATGEKVQFTLNGNEITTSNNYEELIVTYVYNYTNGAKVCKIGQRLLNCFVSLEGRTRVKDDETGKVVTGIIKIPKLKLMSDLSIKLGSQASPIVGTFRAAGIPVGSRGSSYVSEFCFLEDDIDSDL